MSRWRKVVSKIHEQFPKLNLDFVNEIYPDEDEEVVGEGEVSIYSQSLSNIRDRLNTLLPLIEFPTPPPLPALEFSESFSSHDLLAKAEPIVSSNHPFSLNDYIINTKSGDVYK